MRARPRALYWPRSEDELIEILRQAVRAGESVKIFGAGHSPAPIACGDGGRMISLDRLDSPPEIDRARGRVTIAGGTRLHALNELLAREGLALANLGSISEQSLAGATATGTHGTGRERPGLADQLTGLRLIKADGASLDLEADDGRQSFDAFRVHLGALGVVSRATFAVQPAFRLHASEETLSLDETLARLDEFMAAPFFRFWWFPWTPFARVWRATPTERPADPARGTWRAYYEDSLRANRFPESLYALARHRPALVRPVNRLLRRLLFAAPHERVDRSDRIFNFLIQVRQYVMEYAIPIEHTSAALRALQSLIETRNFPAHLPVEVRFTPAARGWLDMATGRATCYIGVIMYKAFGRDPAYEPYFRAVDHLMRDFDGRPHWAKFFYRDREELRALYPRFDEFAALRARLDPDGTFLNEYLRRFF